MVILFNYGFVSLLILNCLVVDYGSVVMLVGCLTVGLWVVLVMSFTYCRVALIVLVGMFYCY